MHELPGTKAELVWCSEDWQIIFSSIAYLHEIFPYYVSKQGFTLTLRKKRGITTSTLLHISVVDNYFKEIMLQYHYCCYLTYCIS